MFERYNNGVGTFLLFSVLFTAVATVFSMFGMYYSKVFFNAYTEAVGADIGRTAPTVVIDAGHGGEDGGASSYGGVPEKELNLLIATELRDMLEAIGINVVMTRTEDLLLYDKSSDYKGHKKSMDLANRLKIARETENAILISIHMNAFPEEQYRGLQVYYSKNTSGSSELARLIQRMNKILLSPDNNRKTKQAGSNIYLLDRFEGTGVLIECGFLSNAEERDKLNTAEYRKQLSACICSAIMEYLANGGK